MKGYPCLNRFHFILKRLQTDRSAASLHNATLFIQSGQ